MANNYYVHIGSGLVVAADECVTVDLDNLPTEILDQLDGDDYCDDQVLHTYAMTIVDGQSSRAACPVGDLVDSPHHLEPGSGVIVDWSVFGDRRTMVEVCADCVEGVPNLNE